MSFDLDHFVLCDTESGTFFSANGAVILDTRWLNEQDLTILNEGSDSERIELCRDWGSRLDDLLDPNQIQGPEPCAESDYDSKGDFSSSWLGN